MIIKFPPISINKCWQGKRFKTADYKRWRESMLWMLKGTPKVKGWVGIESKFYIKNFALADCDNFEKPFFDALVEAGVIDDDRFIKWHRSEKFKSEDERIEFSICTHSLDLTD